VDELLTPADVETPEPPAVMVFGGSEEVVIEAQSITDLLDGLEAARADDGDVAASSRDEPTRTGDFAADLMALGLGELPTDGELAAIEAASEPVEESAPSASPEVIAAGELADLLSSLDVDAAAGEPYSAVLQTPDLGIDTEIDVEPAKASATGVISTDVYLADIEEGAGSFSGGLGDELTALTGGGTTRARPQAVAAKVAPEGEHVLHRDRHVDRALVERIIEGVKKL
jgi:hypothetical protein